MPDTTISVDSLPVNQGSYHTAFAEVICPHCGTRNGVFVSDWEYTRHNRVAYGCRNDKCQKNLHLPTLDDLSEAQCDILQAVIEKPYIRLEALIVASGASASTVNEALKILRLMGVESTKRGYKASEKLTQAFRQSNPEVSPG